MVLETLEWLEIVVIKLKLLVVAALLFVFEDVISSFKLVFNIQISLFKRVVVVNGKSVLIWLACM